MIAPGDRIFWTSQVSGALSVSNPAPGGGGGYVNLAAPHTALGIAPDPTADRMYWADPGANKISFANLDGSGGGDLNTTGATVDLPDAVAIDPAGGRIYWANLTGKISYSNLNGTGGADLDTGAATVATLRRSGHARLNRVAFSGRIGRRTLKPGRYHAVFTATDGAGTSRAEALAFTIVKR